MPKSDLVKYKWAKMESFFQSLKFVRGTEVPWAWRIGRTRPATQPYIVESRENRPLYVLLAGFSGFSIAKLLYWCSFIEFVNYPGFIILFLRHSQV